MMKQPVKLYYYKAEDGNFGDDLNRWLWDRLLPDAFDGICYHRQTDREKNNQESSLFLGIGTLLSQRIPVLPRKIVFTSGAGYGRCPRIDESWLFYAVRGPMTSDQLGLPRDVAAGDGATLLSTVESPQPKRHVELSYVPHHKSAWLDPWKEICKDLGIQYIDSRGNVDDVLDQIASSDLVLSESLHGAVVADTYRVPWIAIHAHPHINTFKWEDWCASIGVAYEPHRLVSPSPTSADPKILSDFRRSARNLKQRRQLLRVVSRARPLLSSDTVHRCVTEGLLERLELLKRDLSRGCFESAYRLGSG